MAKRFTCRRGSSFLTSFILSSSIESFDEVHISKVNCFISTTNRAYNTCESILVMIIVTVGYQKRF